MIQTHHPDQSFTALAEGRLFEFCECGINGAQACRPDIWLLRAEADREGSVLLNPAKASLEKAGGCPHHSDGAIPPMECCAGRYRGHLLRKPLAHRAAAHAT